MIITSMKSENRLIMIVALIAYLVMIVVNALANILPINNMTTGAISDSYPNLFAPAGITFSIWGLIYLLLGAYILFQFEAIKNVNTQRLAGRINGYFILSSVINSVWIFAWHYKLIWITVLLMVALLICLIKIADIVRIETLTFREKLFVKVPFGVYLGWITIATIANVITLLVSVGWRGFGISDSVWMVIILITGALISGWRMLKDANIAYGLVPAWAYLGIWVKHTSPAGFDGQYPLIVSTTLLCIAVLLLANGYLVMKRRWL